MDNKELLKAFRLKLKGKSFEEIETEMDIGVPADKIKEELIKVIRNKQVKLAPVKYENLRKWILEHGYTIASFSEQVSFMGKNKRFNFYRKLRGDWNFTPQEKRRIEQITGLKKKEW